MKHKINNQPQATLSLAEDIKEKPWRLRTFYILGFPAEELNTGLAL